jgi:hypothetical protein
VGNTPQNNTTEGARACDLRPGPGLGWLKVLEWKEVFRVSSSIWWSMATSLFVWGIVVASKLAQSSSSSLSFGKHVRLRLLLKQAAIAAEYEAEG